METPKEFLEKVMNASSLTSGSGFPAVSLDTEANSGEMVLEFTVGGLLICVLISDLEGKSQEEMVGMLTDKYATILANRKAWDKKAKDFTL